MKIILEWITGTFCSITILSILATMVALVVWVFTDKDEAEDWGIKFLTITACSGMCFILCMMCYWSIY